MGEHDAHGGANTEADAAVGPVRSIPDAGRRVLLMTRSGGAVDLMNPDLETIVLDDIAWSLAHAGRWANQCRVFYSVAHHSIRVGDTLLGPNGNKRLALIGLLHDAHEYLLCDIPKPFKMRLVNYGVWASRLQGAIYRRFGVDPLEVEYQAVIAVDETERRWEAYQFMSREQLLKCLPKAANALGPPIHPMTPEQAYETFLDRARRYGVTEGTV